MIKRIMVSISVIIACAAAANAGDGEGRYKYRGDPNTHCRSDWGISCCQMRVAICPQGDFEPISEGCGGDDDYIWIEALHDDGRTIPGIPVTDYWLQACDPADELCLCASPFVADSVTNADGRTTISGSIAGGGCALNGLYLRIQGIFVVEWTSGCIDIACRDIIIVSVDLNADCLVNLSDLAVLGLTYNKALGDAGYNTCCDYNDDDVCNLSDFAYLGGAHYQHACR